MSKFLDWMTKELENMLYMAIISPTQEVKSGERVIGVMEDLETQKIYTLMKHVEGELRELAKEAEHEEVNRYYGDTVFPCSIPDFSMDIFYQGLYWLDVKREILDRLILISLESKLSDEVTAGIDWGTDAIGIRIGWQIVTYRPESTYRTFQVHIPIGILDTLVPL